jgi:c-di-GMP-binding flagellar brake protein YcgR
MSAIAEDKNFMIWQRDAAGEISFQVKGKLISVNDDNEMEFSLVEDIACLKKTETFFAVEDTTVVFKSNKVQVDGSRVLTQIPDEAKYKERRRHDRKKFKLKDYIEVSLDFRLEGDETEILSKVIDISDSGICIIISKEILCKLKTKENFLINAMSESLGFKSEVGKIMNVRKYKRGANTGGEFYALGVMFL